MIIGLVTWGGYSIFQIPIGAVPDITNNQVQIITTSRNLATEEVEKFISYPVELEMANLPGVLEIRSISKFGLSVVTVVFEDDMGTYLPRQLIAEKLKSAREKIPPHFGSPEMGPISTGLGEIYQYVLEVEPAYQSQYSVMDLRTIQDWVVKRQLSGIPGVVEVNTWGGYLKQYEVSLNPQKLKALNISIAEIFNALEKNNDVTGGGYIEKYEQTYFVRGEGLIKSLEEIEQIVVKTTGNVPLLIRDVAKVTYGHATRFGAITGNGQGEKVMGQIMMLKNANSKQVIENVKARVDEIQKVLPEGITINPFLERTELIDKTTHTVAENLLLGALIVIFVLVLLLGNFRSGLIVASVIPLSLLFGISLMNLFGISANLMSLGAIDFGIIIDGAVIIIEFILFQFSKNQGQLIHETKITQSIRDNITIESASKVMEPAIFGQIIILIVFIPILALSGIEGKMFGPMALSFGFTLLGAMLLCLTYVPMVSSLIGGRSDHRKKGILDKVSDRIMAFLYKIYKPVIQWALKRHKLVLGSAVIFLTVSLFIFSRMGGEFIPTLDEGDYVVQPVLKTGTSLSKTIDLMTQLENILMDSFPEVDQVVSRIGAAEVPTDPMSMEETDVIIKLKPKGEWRSASSKAELAGKMKSAMSVIPGMDFEFTQPIEMRFNELITGVRSDLAIKIYGEDLDTLFRYANTLKQLIHNVEGAADIIVEKTDDLPQISVEYDRKRLAQLGLNTSDLNRMVRLAFGGETAGAIYEGEKRFDLVVRFQERFRTDIENMKDLYVDLPNGSQIPLREVATIDYKKGPAKISRDNTKRRIVIGINVRNRDVSSLVEEIQEIVKDKFKLPYGYSLTYGGQFENLQNAIKRLQLAVPAALAMIFIMLRFALRSFRRALLVYSAIPLAAIGGILALWVRGLPFSISAGVGFIALFGIAVLNGIVLIEFFTQLEGEGITNIRERILMGAKQRLRPVLLTASAAALGFLPMAVSTSAGAEVQRPLATVVIGGLFTSTILTLVILPVLYMLFGVSKTKKVPSNISPKSIALLLLIAAFLIPSVSSAQTKIELSLTESITVALENNLKLKALELDIDRNQLLKRTAFDLGKTSFYHAYDENNIAENGFPLNVYGISQSIPFPSVMSTQRQLASQRISVSEESYELEKVRITRQVSKLFYRLQFLQQKITVLKQLDSLFKVSLQAVNRKFELGESDYLEVLNAKAHRVSLLQQKNDVTTQYTSAELEFTQLLRLDKPPDLPFAFVKKLPFTRQNVSSALINHAGLRLQQAILVARKSEVKLERNKLLPDINLEYFMGRGINENAQNLFGYQLGVSFPLFYHTQKARIKAKNVEYAMYQNLSDLYQLRLSSEYKRGANEIQNSLTKLKFYEDEGLSMAEEIAEMARKKYTLGETGFITFIQSMENVQRIKLSYLDQLNTYNQLVLDLNYLTIE